MWLAPLTAASQVRAPTPWYLIDPSGPFSGVWELVGAVVLFLHVALFTPFEVSFLEPTMALFLLGRMVDFFFFCDMVLQFVTMIPRATDPSQFETKLHNIALNYFQNWFFVDVMALGASAFDIVPFFLNAFELKERNGDTRRFYFFRVVRIFRLVKLLRLLKASHILKQWSVKIATPRATVTIINSVAECLMVSHLIACSLALITIFPPTRLESWFATLGFCLPAVVNHTSGETFVADALALADDIRGLDEPDVATWCFEIQQRARAAYDDDTAAIVDGLSCVAKCGVPGATPLPELYLYLQCMWWAFGMLMGAPISLTPHQGPYTPYFTPGRAVGRAILSPWEQFYVLIAKVMTAFLWTRVIARFVQVYNNLDPDAAEFRMGWDALNRFVSYFKVTKADAHELRSYYMERAEKARAKSRKRVMNDFSPQLQEKFVWKLSKEWLMRVPCFMLVVERLIAKPDSGMERFLVKVALKMQPAVFVPSERPPAHRLYIVTNGLAVYKGKKKLAGSSWGAEDVLLRSRSGKQCYRAVASTYLHVLCCGADVFENIKELGPEYLSAYMLTKLWATIYATGSAIVEQHRKATQTEKVRVGTGEGMIWPEEVERRINRGLTSIDPMRDEAGEVVRSRDGHEQYTLKYHSLELGSYEIIKQWDQDANKFTYRVLPKEGTREYAAMLNNELPGITPQHLQHPTLMEQSALGGSMKNVVDGARHTAVCGGPASASDATAIAASANGFVSAPLLRRPVELPAPAPTAASGDAGAAAVARQLASLTSLFKQQSEQMGGQLLQLAQQLEKLTLTPPALTWMDSMEA